MVLAISTNTLIFAHKKWPFQKRIHKCDFSLYVFVYISQSLQLDIVLISSARYVLCTGTCYLLLKEF